MTESAGKHVAFYRHHLSEDSCEVFREVANSSILSNGTQVRAFEEDLADFLGASHVVALSTCTDALTLVLRGLGIGSGMEVITSPLTFASTAASIIMAGAKPVFADVDPKTALLTPESVEARITENTAGLIVVHLYGAMADIGAFRLLARRYNLRLVEDAAHCVEGNRDGVRPGTQSDAACFSFYATKNITSGEGGAVATPHSDLAQWLRLVRNHGMVRPASSPSSGHYVHWDIETIGTNAKMTDFQAGLLRTQIPGIGKRLQRRAAIAEQYDIAVERHPRLERPSLPRGVTSSRHLYTVWAPLGRRDELIADLEAGSIQVGVHYRCLSRLSFIRRMGLLSPGECPVADTIGERTVSVPLYPALTDEEVRQVVAALSATLRWS